MTDSISQVALKRQQAAEDALALNMRSVASGEAIQHLPEGPIIGLPCGAVKHTETNAERRIKGERIHTLQCIVHCHQTSFWSGTKTR